MSVGERIARQDREYIDRLEKAVAGVRALADEKDARALEQAAYGQNVEAAVLAMDARAIRGALDEHLGEQREWEPSDWKPQADPTHYSPGRQ